LWQEILGAPKLVLWDLAVGRGGVYALVVPPWAGLHPSFDGLALAALDAGSGTLRWQQHPAGEVFPYVAATGDVVVLASETGLAGLNAADGTTLWHQLLAQGGNVTAAADDTAILSSVTASGAETAETWAGTLCALQQATGMTRWCDHFVTGLAAVVLGP
jgi:outer membrane protein assembly factor BamB